MPSPKLDTGKHGAYSSGTYGPLDEVGIKKESWGSVCLPTVQCAVVGKLQYDETLLFSQGS